MPMIASVLNQFLQDPGTYFERILNQSLFQKLLQSEQPKFRNRVFTPLITLWCWTIQSLSADQSCRYAVAAWIAHQSQSGRERICSSATGAYSQARARLSLSLIQKLVQHLGAELEKRTEAWCWKGLHVKIADGTTFSAPDTAANRELYLKPKGRALTPEAGLPKVRAVGLFSLASGALLALKISPMRGPDTGENTLLRKLLHFLNSKDLLLIDRAFSGFVDLALLQRRKIQFVARKQEMQHTDFRRGKRLGKHDHLMTLHRPGLGSTQSPMSRRLLPHLPRQIILREVRIIVQVRGFRAKRLDLITSLLDPKRYSREELARLYAERWQVEVDFRILKSTLSMGRLRCKTPEMIQKEIWVHLFGYNLIRLMMLDATRMHRVSMLEISFKETLQLLEHFKSLIWSRVRNSQWLKHYFNLLRSIKDRVKNRPYRIEPRALKFNPRSYNLLKVPREKAREFFWKKSKAWENRGRDYAYA